MRKWWLIISWLLIGGSFSIFQASPAAHAQQYSESPYVFIVEAEHCLHEADATATDDPQIRRQTGFRVQGVAGVVTALHGIVDCEAISAFSESEAGEAFGDLAIIAVDIDRDIARLLPKGIAADQVDTLAQVGFVTAPDEQLPADVDLHLIGHPYGARAQYTTEQITLRKTSTDTLALLLPSSLTAKLRLRNSPNPDVDVLSIEGNLVPGHSGAPVLNQLDQVVGVGDGGLGDELSWLIPWHKIHWQTYDAVWSRINKLKLQNPSEIFFDVVDSLPTSSDYMVYTGRVLDEEGNFVSRARVVLDLGGESHIVYTDAEGKFAITAAANQPAQGRIYIQATGYSPLSRLIDLLVARRQPNGEEFAVSRTQTAAVLCPFGFRIIDPNQAPIRGAHVSVRYHLDVVEAYTNSDGEFWGELPCDKQNPRVDVEVSAPGYILIEKNYLLYNTLIKIQLSTLATATATPVAAITATPTPTPTTTAQPATILFHDDFAHGIDPAWRQAEAITTVNGKLTLNYRDEEDWLQGSILSEEAHWHQYRLIVDLNQQGFFYAEARRESQLLVHYQDENNFLALLFSDAFDERPPSWFIVQDGMWIEHTFTQDFYPEKSQLQVKLEVDNDTIVTYFDGKVVDLWSAPPFTDGAVGVLLKTKGVEAPWVDNFVMEALNTVSPTPTATATSIATSLPPTEPPQLCSFAFIVLDNQSEEPIRRASIAVLIGVKQDAGTTDSTGYYLAKLPCNNTHDVEARVRVSANGYVVYNRSLFLSDETTEILLERETIPTLTPTVTATPTPIPTATDTPVTTAVATPTTIEKPSCQVVGVFSAIWYANREKLGCNTSDVITSPITYEPFEGGYLVWSKLSDLIYVLPRGSYWSQQVNSWGPDENSLPCNQAQQFGYPAMGFGKLWCINEKVHTALGNPLDKELPNGFAQQQYFAGGFVFEIAGGETVILFQDGTWSIN